MTHHDPAPAEDALRCVVDRARSFLACRDQVAEILAGRVPPAATLAEAIDRDFLFFDLERAAEALREALRAVPSRPN